MKLDSGQVQRLHQQLGEVLNRVRDALDRILVSLCDMGNLLTILYGVDPSLYIKPPAT